MKNNLLKATLGNELYTLLNDPDVIEVMANPDGSLHVEYLARGKQVSDSQISAQQANNIIKVIAASRSHIITDDQPELSIELNAFNARFQGWIPPVVKAPCFAIRKHSSHILRLDHYVKEGLITQAQAEQLKNALTARKNIIVSGGTSSGKTTFTNALLAELNDSNERIIVLEDLPELQINNRDHVKLRTTETRSMRDLVKGVLRMRPDRIIIGEVRDGSALDLLKAWNTGHPGGICTLHANSAALVKPRLAELIQEVSSHVPEALIDRSVDVVVHLGKDAKGQRIVQEILEY